NQSYGEPIFPTPIIGMVGLFDSLDDITPNAFQEAGDVIYLVGETGIDFGGSELQNLLESAYRGQAPAIDLEVEKTRQNQVLEAIKSGVIASAEDIAEGGLAVALAESVIRAKALGADVQLEGEATTAYLVSHSH